MWDLHAWLPGIDRPHRWTFLPTVFHTINRSFDYHVGEEGGYPLYGSGCIQCHIGPFHYVELLNILNLLFYPNYVLNKNSCFVKLDYLASSTFV